MQHVLHNLNIRTVAAALPRQSLDLRELGGLFGQEEVDRIIATTGIRRVRVAPEGMCASDLCEAAARAAFQAAGLTGADMDAVLFLSQTPDYRLPATSPILQEHLGLPKEALAFDINLGCSAYIYGLFQAGLLVSSGACRRVLVLAGDTSTRMINPGDKSVRMVFGDAGSATIVESGTDAASFLIRTDGDGARNLIIPAGGFRRPADSAAAEVTTDENGNRRSALDLFMDGMEIMNFGLREVPPAIDGVLALAGWKKAETGSFVLHQANRFMLEYLRRKMQLPAAAMPVAMADTGNTGPASIPLALTVARDQLQQEDRLRKCVLCGFGVGLSWGAAAADLGNAQILDPIEV